MVAAVAAVVVAAVASVVVAAVAAVVAAVVVDSSDRPSLLTDNSLGLMWLLVPVAVVAVAAVVAVVAVAAHLAVPVPAAAQQAQHLQAVLESAVACSAIPASRRPGQNPSQ